ncbi:hypothetical protein SAMN05192583_0548 [Sphingomonas gellani]|uniref:Uncharacterized protein n=1 Tax=Sphingomonas gellani TaxID=1166340 RepID=A0A1H7Z5G9_9SPHN|nr:hypothetical protein SAMN05192583_0548 [Sphingomonas gellani]
MGVAGRAFLRLSGSRGVLLFWSGFWVGIRVYGSCRVACSVVGCGHGYGAVGLRSSVVGALWVPVGVDAGAFVGGALAAVRVGFVLVTCLAAGIGQGVFVFWAVFAAALVGLVTGAVVALVAAW